MRGPIERRAQIVPALDVVGFRQAVDRFPVIVLPPIISLSLKRRGDGRRDNVIADASHGGGKKGVDHEKIRNWFVCSCQCKNGLSEIRMVFIGQDTAQ